MTVRRGLAAASILLVLLVLLVPLSARAAPPERIEIEQVEQVALLYEATATCPSQVEFTAMVRAFAGHWAVVPEGTTPQRTIRVRLSERGSETVGTLVVSTPAGTLSERTIVGPTCAGVSRALAIMVGVAIDPRAGSADDAKPAPVLRPDEPRAERPSIRPERPPSAPPPSPPPRGSSVAFDLRIETTSAVVRGSLLGFGASMKLVLPLATGPSWMRGWKPSLGLGLRQSLPKERSLRGGSVDFLWTAGNLRACPHEFAIAGLASLAPCAEMNLGILRASAEGFADSRQASITWLDIGGSVWAAVSLSKHVFLSSTVLLTAPLFRRPFVLASGTAAASVPAIGVLGGIGIGTRM